MAASLDRGTARQEHYPPMLSRSSTFPIKAAVPQSSESSDEKATGQYEEVRLSERIVETIPHSLTEGSKSSYGNVPWAEGEDDVTASMDDRSRSSMASTRQRSITSHTRASTGSERPKSNSSLSEKPHRARNITLDHTKKHSVMSSSKRLLGMSAPRATPGPGDALELLALEHQMEQRLERKDKHIQRLEGEKAADATRIHELEDQLAKQESQIAAIQGQHFENLRGQGRNMAKDDEVVRGELQSCITGWRVWAKKYALKDMADLTEIRHLLKNHLVSHNARVAKEQWLLMNFMLLNAELSRFISDKIIRRPFLCLEELNMAGGSIDIPCAFQIVYNKLLHDDYAQGCIWRSDTLRLLADLEKSSGDAERTRRQDAYYEGLAGTFENGPARMLLRRVNRNEAVTRSQELEKLLRDAGHLFSSLFTQRGSVVTKGIEKLGDEVFYADSREMAAHGSYKLEEGSRKLDGRRVQMVISPAVVVHGDEDGTSYSQSKVWAKAVVCVAEN